VNRLISDADLGKVRQLPLAEQAANHARNWHVKLPPATMQHWGQEAANLMLKLLDERATGSDRLNPNHPVAQAVENQWHTLCALAMLTMKTDHVVITPEIADMASDGEVNIAVQELQDGVHLYLVDKATAVRLAREHGGLPV